MRLIVSHKNPDSYRTVLENVELKVLLSKSKFPLLLFKLGDVFEEYDFSVDINDFHVSFLIALTDEKATMYANQLFAFHSEMENGMILTKTSVRPHNRGHLYDVKSVASAANRLGAEILVKNGKMCIVVLQEVLKKGIREKFDFQSLELDFDLREWIEKIDGTNKNLVSRRKALTIRLDKSSFNEGEMLACAANWILAYRLTLKWPSVKEAYRLERLLVRMKNTGADPKKPSLEMQNEDDLFKLAEFLYYFDAKLLFTHRYCFVLVDISYMFNLS